MDPNGFRMASHRPRRFRMAAHRPHRFRSSPRRRWVAGGVVVTVAAAASAALAFHGLSFATRPSAGGCTGTPVTVTVATAQSDLATFSALARRWNSTTPASGGRCLAATVVPAEPGDVAGHLGPDWNPAGTGTPPQVWLPDSRLWLADAAARPEAARLLPANATSVASSPVVLGVRQSVAQGLGWPGRPLSGTDVLGALADPGTAGKLGRTAGAPMLVGMTDPRTSTAGLAMTLATLDPTGSGTVTDAQLLAGLRFSQVLGPVVPDVQTLLAQQDRPPVAPNQGVVAALPALERDIAVYDAAAPSDPLVPVYLPNGVLADYPYTILSAGWVDPAHRAAAEQFRQFLLGPTAQELMMIQSLRRPDRTLRTTQYLPPARGFQATVPPPRPVESPAALRQMLAQWASIQRPSNVLVVLDTSGSMNFPVPGGTTSKLQLLQQVATAGFGLLTNVTTIGLWDFSVGPDRAGEHRELVPVGPIFGPLGGGTRQQALYGAVNGLHANGYTPLYDTALAAFLAMQGRWRPDATNVVLLVTDGANELNGGLDLPGVVDRLRGAQRADQPVQIDCVAVGSAADVGALQQIAGATGGHTLLARDPMQAVQQLVLAFAGRVG